MYLMYMHISTNSYCGFVVQSPVVRIPALGSNPAEGAVSGRSVVEVPRIGGLEPRP